MRSRTVLMILVALVSAGQGVQTFADTLTITSGSYAAFQDFSAAIDVRGERFSIFQPGTGISGAGMSPHFGGGEPGEVRVLTMNVNFGGALRVDGEQSQILSGRTQTTVPPVPLAETTIAPFTLTGTILARPLEGGTAEEFLIVGAGMQTFGFRPVISRPPGMEPHPFLLFESTRLDFAAIPEPSSIVLLMCGIVSALGWRLRHFIIRL